MTPQSLTDAFSKDDILFLMNNKYGLRHVSGADPSSQHKAHTVE